MVCSNSGRCMAICIAGYKGTKRGKGTRTMRSLCGALGCRVFSELSWRGSQARNERTEPGGRRTRVGRTRVGGRPSLSHHITSFHSLGGTDPALVRASTLTTAQRVRRRARVVGATSRRGSERVALAWGQNLALRRREDLPSNYVSVRTSARPLQLHECGGGPWSEASNAVSMVRAVCACAHHLRPCGHA